MEPKDWQNKAIEAWIKNNKKGTVKAPTGSGKSYLAIMAYRISNCPNMVVIVPSINLKGQWEKDLKEENINADVVVINTARKNPKYFLNYDLIILDEIHHYAAPQSKVIFDYIKEKHVLGLSATPERQDEEHKIFGEVAPIVYDYYFTDAIKNKDMSKFKIEDVPVLDINPELDILTKKINTEFKYFHYDLKGVFRNLKYGDSEGRKRAAILMRRINYRKKMLFDCDVKNKKAIEQILKHLDDKIIVFTELISSAEKICEGLKKENIESLMYHSGLKKDEREGQLAEFRTGEKSIIVAVKALDEGVNIPDANVGIIVSGTSVRRQFIQRLGRVLRHIEGKVAKLYQIYVSGTKDEDWKKKRSASIKKQLTTL